jgi:hypothetical protein
VCTTLLGHNFVACLLHLTCQCLNALQHAELAFSGLPCLGVVVVTSSVIKSLVVPATPVRHGEYTAGSPSGASAARRALPLPALSMRRRNNAVYGLAAVDCRGRVADHAVVTALGWVPGTRLNIGESRGLLVIRADAHGVFSVTTQGHLRLSATVRHCCGSLVTACCWPPTYSVSCSSCIHPPRWMTCSLSATPGWGTVISRDDAATRRIGSDFGGVGGRAAAPGSDGLIGRRPISRAHHPVACAYVR